VGVGDLVEHAAPVGKVALGYTQVGLDVGPAILFWFAGLYPIQFICIRYIRVSF
jgi:hypothetical protein